MNSDTQGIQTYMCYRPICITDLNVLQTYVYYVFVYVFVLVYVFVIQTYMYYKTKR